MYAIRSYYDITTIAIKHIKMDKQDYFTRFGINETIIQTLINVGLSKGGDYCDVYFQHSIDSHIGLEDKAVNRAHSNVDFGVGIRVLQGDQTGFSFSEELTIEAMSSAALTAANIANGAVAKEAQPFKIPSLANYYPIQTPWEEVSIKTKIPFLQTINDRVFALDARVIKSNVSFVDGSSYVLFANSEGCLTFDYQPMVQLAVSCTAEQNGKKEQNSYNLSAREGIEFFTPAIVEQMAQEVVARTIILFDAVKPRAGEMPVVLAAGSSGILLHEAIGHGMEADFNVITSYSIHYTKLYESTLSYKDEKRL